jgi:hypothetical protein
MTSEGLAKVNLGGGNWTLATSRGGLGKDESGTTGCCFESA